LGVKANREQWANKVTKTKKNKDVRPPSDEADPMNGDFQSTLVIVPARGGSKRIPDKNVKPISGQPMIYWPLMALAGLFNAENVLVSTDSQLVKPAVEATGLSVPFKRPANLSDDFTGTAEVVAHALKWFEDNVRKVDYVLTVYPTAVLLSEEDIVAAMNSLRHDEKLTQ
jgi:pseudaminic acid cytidylyltransferase